MFPLLIHNILITQVFHALKYTLQHKHFVANQIHSILHNILIFLLHTLMDLTCIQDNLILIDEYISGKIVLDNSNNKFVFPAINVSNNFATIDYDANINTKNDYTINHVFRSMTVQELYTLHTICELGRNQLLTILAMSVQSMAI